jgi:hypothetical protein
MTVTEMLSATTQMAVLAAGVWKDLMAMEPSVIVLMAAICCSMVVI